MDVVLPLIAQSGARGEALQRIAERVRPGYEGRHPVDDKTSLVHCRHCQFIDGVARLQRRGPLVIDVPVDEPVHRLVDRAALRVGHDRDRPPGRSTRTQTVTGQIAAVARLGALVVVVAAKSRVDRLLQIGGDAQVLRVVARLALEEGLEGATETADTAVVLIVAGPGRGLVVRRGGRQLPVVRKVVVGDQAGAYLVPAVAGRIPGRFKDGGVDRELGRGFQLSAEIAATPGAGDREARAGNPAAGVVGCVAIGGIRAQPGDRIELVVCLLVHHTTKQLQIVGRVPHRRGHHAGAFGATQVVGARDRVVVDAVVAAVDKADVKPQRTLVGGVGVAAGVFVLPVIAGQCAELATRTGPRTLGDVVHRPGERAPAEGRRLRTADHLDPLQVLQPVSGDVTVHEDAVDEERGVRFALDIGHAADHRAIEATSERGAEREARRERGDIAHVLEALFLDGLGTYRRDRNRDRLQGFGDATRRHLNATEGDRIQLTGRFRRGFLSGRLLRDVPRFRCLGQRKRRHEQAGGNAATQQRGLQSGHARDTCRLRLGDGRSRCLPGGGKER